MNHGAFVLTQHIITYSVRPWGCDRAVVCVCRRVTTRWCRVAQRRKVHQLNAFQRRQRIHISDLTARTCWFEHAQGGSFSVWLRPMCWGGLCWAGFHSTAALREHISLRIIAIPLVWAGMARAKLHGGGARPHFTEWAKMNEITEWAVYIYIYLYVYNI